MIDPQNILVIGGSGSIGQAMVTRLLEQYPDALVTATYCSTKPQWQLPNLQWQHVDITQESDIQDLCSKFKQLDWFINCAGLLHDKSSGPEKSISQLDPEFFDKNIRINTLPTLLLAKHLNTAFKQSPEPVFASISARVGSIQDNHLGGWYSYRSSKAALNMALKTLSIEWRRTVKNGCVAALHPGTNDSYLSKPFQAHVPEGKLFKPQQTAKRFVKQLAQLGPEDSGRFWAWDGSSIPW